MRSNIFSLSILNLLRPAIVVGVLLCIYIFAAVSIFPLVLRFPELADYINTSLQQNTLYSSLVGNVNDPVGYLNFIGFSLLLPLVLSIFAVAAGEGSMNGSESRAAVELLLARPIHRRRLILEKFTALSVVLFLMCAALWLVIALRSGPSRLWIDPWHLAQSMISLTLLSLFYVSAGLAAGSLLRSSTSSRITALAVIGLPLAFFLMQSLPGTAGQLKFLSPFYYAAGANPLGSGLQPGAVVILAGLTTACLVLAVAAFDKRDL